MPPGGSTDAASFSVEVIEPDAALAPRPDRLAAAAAACVRHRVALFLRPVDLVTLTTLAQTRGMSVTAFATEMLATLAVDYRTAHRTAPARAQALNRDRRE
jgi:hypothetical protein